MTNRSKAAKINNPLRYLDLSFEGRQRTSTGEINNGLKPHGGYRGKKKHPPSPLSFDKTREYHENLRQDIDKLLEEDDLKVHGSPAWVCDASREVHHGGESPLFARRLLSASRVEPPKSAGPTRQVKSARTRQEPPPMREGVTYYRPNRTHQYLTTTELKDHSQVDSNLKYGRPTRATLLRARQRSNSAPINAYEVRREMIQRAEERKAKNPCFQNKQEMLNLFINTGESQHAWLIGARYNRPQLVDAKSISLYGRYLPRNNPARSFSMHSVNHKPKDDEMGCPTPDSSASDEEEDVTHSQLSQRVRSAPAIRKQLTNQSPPLTRNAWGESVTSLVETADENNEGAVQDDTQIMEEVIVWPDALNVKGNRVFVPRVDSVKKSILPVVQGISWRSPRRREKAEESISSQPPPTTPVGYTSSRGDHQEKIKLEDLITKRSYSSRGPPSDKSPSEALTGDPKVSAPKKIKPVLVDRSVNVPSISGESGILDSKDNPLICTSLLLDNKTDAKAGENVAAGESSDRYSLGEPINTHNTPVDGSQVSAEVHVEGVNKGTDNIQTDHTEESAMAGDEAGVQDTLETPSVDPPETEKSQTQINDDDVTFFITEDFENKGSDSAVRLEEEKTENEQDDGNSVSPEAEIKNDTITDNATRAERQLDPNNLEDPTQENGPMSDRDTIDNCDIEDDINSPQPVIQVKVDISKKSEF